MKGHRRPRLADDCQNSLARTGMKHLFVGFTDPNRIADVRLHMQ